MAESQPVEFHLPSPEYAAVRWTHNEHMHGSESPLIQEAGLDMGAGMQPDGLPNSFFVNGYSYYRAQNLDYGRMAARGIELRGIDTWYERWEPRIAEAAHQLTDFEPSGVGAGGWDAAITARVTLMGAIFGRLHMETMFVVLPAAHVFVQRWMEAMGSNSPDGARALLQGFPNESSRRMAAAWELSRIAAEDPNVARAVAEGRVPDASSDAGRRFQERFATFLERWGHTTTMHLQDLPTWREDPSRPLAMIAAYIDQDESQAPERVAAAQVQAREQGEAELARLAETSEAARSAQEALIVARYLTPVSEDHNVLGDHKLLAASRTGWLKVGEFLVERKAIAEPGDVFYLRRQELIDLAEGRVALLGDGVVEERRALQAAWRATTPPAFLPMELDESTRVLRGEGASPGVYRGRARVIASLDDAETLEPGDILIASATGPEWTIYFAMLGALVTNVGGVLTHAAVVSREFGIPAVVGAGEATRLIRDGDIITVDGSAGTVTIER